MKKKRMILSGIVVMLFLTMLYIGKQTVPINRDSDLLMQNVEALGQNESSSGYSNTHLACYKTVNYGGIPTLVQTGKYRATCWANPNSSKSYHSHACSTCSSF